MADKKPAGSNRDSPGTGLPAPDSMAAPTIRVYFRMTAPAAASTSLPAESPPDALQERLGEFEASLVGKSPRTAATYRTANRQFATFLAATRPFAEWRAADLQPTVLEDFYRWLVSRHGREARPTITTYLAGARAFLRFLARRGLLRTGVSYEQMRENLREVAGRATYRTPRIDRRIPLIVTYVKSLPLPEATERRGARRLELLRDQTVLQTLFCTGMRREEVARLNREDVEDGMADRALITGKGDKERVVFFDAETLAAIRAYLAARGDTHRPLFLRHDNRRGRAPGPGGSRWRLSAQSVWLIVKRYARAVGVPASTHHFRHTKASVLLNRGASLSEVQDILGHASPETTKRIYAHYKAQHLREAFDRFSASPEQLAAELRQPVAD